MSGLLLLERFMEREYLNITTKKKLISETQEPSPRSQLYYP